MKKTVIIKIDETDLKSIKAAERKKARLENAGYRLVSTVCGLLRSTMIYVNDNS